MPSPFALARKAAQDFMQSFAGGRGTVQALIDREIARLNSANDRADVQFGPGDAPTAQPLDQTGQPRAYQYRVGWNIPSLPGEGRPLPYETLEQLASTWWVLSKGIELRADQLLALRFDIVARDPDKKAAKAITGKRQAEIAAIRAFFDRPDQRHTRQAWLRAILWDHLVYDAIALWKRRTLGGQLHSLRYLSSPTLKPLLDVHGDQPEPPAAAYQQYLYGVARDSFTSEELVYAIKNRRITSPYGRSPVEQFMWQINTALRYERSVLDRYTDGTLPEGWAVAPPGTTPQQLNELRTWWDDVMAGDTRAMHQLQWVPAGTDLKVIKELTGFDESFSRWLVRLGCAAIGVTPQELGFPEQESLGGKGFAEEQSAVQKRKGTGPLARWLCDEVFNPIIWTDFGCPDLQATFVEEGDEEDQLQAMQARDLAIRSGQLSIDQVVEEDGGTPPGIGRLFVVGNNVLFEPDLVLGSKEGAHAVAGVELDTPGIGEKPPGAPKPGTPGSNDMTPMSEDAPLTPADVAARARTPKPTAQPPNGQPPAGAQQKAAELDRFLTFARKRQQAGKWRDFDSTLLAPDTLKALNTAARAGASGDELRALVGLGDQPAPFRRRVAATEEAYRGFTRRLGTRVADEIDRA